MTSAVAEPLAQEPGESRASLIRRIMERAAAHGIEQVKLATRAMEHPTELSLGEMQILCALIVRGY